MTGNDRATAEKIISQAKVFGADLAGIARVSDLKDSPSHWLSKIMPGFEGVGTHPSDHKKRGIVQWPERARSAIVIAVAHPRSRPELDWWVDSEKKKTVARRVKYCRRCEMACPIGSGIRNAPQFYVS